MGSREGFNFPAHTPKPLDAVLAYSAHSEMTWQSRQIAIADCASNFANGPCEVG